MFKTPTVQQIERVTKTIVKIKYLPSRGTATDVGGIISARRRKNTVKLTSTEMHKVIFSPESDGT